MSSLTGFLTPYSRAQALFGHCLEHHQVVAVYQLRRLHVAEDGLDAVAEGIYEWDIEKNTPPR